jgi:hypothetical protein
MTPTEMHIDALMQKIEKLESENVRVWEIHNEFLNNKYTSTQKETHQLREENARLREALENIMRSNYGGYAEDIAREALKGNE